MRRYPLNKIVVLMTVVGMLFYSAQGFCAQDFDNAAQEITKEADRADRDARITIDLVNKSKAELTEILSETKRRIKAEQKDLDALKVEFDKLSKQELELSKELTNEYQEVEDVEGSVRGALKDAASMVRDNPITAENPGRSKLVNGLMNSKEFPGMSGIKDLVDLYFDELSAGKAIVRYSGEFVDTDGRMTSGEILRAGRFTAYFRKADGTVGFLKPDSAGERLIAVSGKVPSDARKAIEAYFNGKRHELPVDPSGGAVFAQLTEETDWRDFMEQGGVLMWPILAVAALAVLFMIERLIVLGTTKANTDKITEEINAAADQGDWKQCRLQCEQNKRVPTCRMLDSAINHIGSTQDVLENALQEAILREMPRLERFLPTLGVLAAIAPLLGLLGTVTGMINIFRVITVVGTGDPRVMSGGISEALLTTQFGLAVAIPIMIIHHFLERRVDKIVGDMEEKGTAFAVTLIKQGAVTESEAGGV